MNAVQVIGSVLAVWSVGSVAITGIYAWANWRRNNRIDRWANASRDRQHIDRVKVGKLVQQPVNYLHFVQHPADSVGEARELGRALDVDGLERLYAGDVGSVHNGGNI